MDNARIELEKLKNKMRNCFFYHKHRRQKTDKKREKQARGFINTPDRQSPRKSLVAKFFYIKLDTSADNKAHALPHTERTSKAGAAYDARVGARG